MQQVKGEATINKLIMLFVFDKMEIPMSENTLTDMCCSANKWIAYMDLKPILTDLVEAEFLYVTANPNQGTLYTITTSGRSCLAQFFTRIPASVREDISKFVKENRLKYRRKQEYFSDYFKNADGSYTVVLRIIEPTQSTMDLRLNVPNRTTAKYIYTKWKDKAAQVYFSIYEQLVE